MERDPFDLVGEVLDGQFRIEAVAGLSDCNVLYRGRALAGDALVAVQCLRFPSSIEGARVRTLAEAFHAGGRLHHQLAQGNPSVAQSVALGSALAKTGMLIPFFVRHWLEGESLAGDLARRRTEGRKGRSILEALTLLAPAFEAAVDAQAGNELHLALNPRNLFLADRDGHRSLQVLDFGVARAMNELRPVLPEYAAPEQLDAAVGAVGPWSDVYTLAVVTLELLSDRVVVAGRQEALDEVRRPTPRVLGVSMSHDLEVALSRAVSLSPDGRQSNVAELWGAVKSAMQPPAAVAGAVPPRRLFVPSSPSVGTMPLGFQPGTPRAPTYVPVPKPAEPDLPPVHVVTTPLPPRVETPALPPVIVETQTPLPVAAPPPPLPPDLPPRPPPSPTFPVIETRRRGRAGTLLASALIGLGAGAGLVILGLHLRAARASAAPASVATAVASPPAPSLAPTLVSALALTPASAQAPALAPDQSPAPATSPASAAPSAIDLPPTDHFLASAARQSLDGLAPVVAKCRRGKVWGIATATVHFGNDGTVSHVEISVPFTATPTGACVSETLATARVGAFGGKPGIFSYRFYVAPK
jgi:hypothetical protein